MRVNKRRSLIKTQVREQCYAFGFNSFVNNYTLSCHQAENFEQYVGKNPVMALKGAKVSDFGGEEELCACQEMYITTKTNITNKINKDLYYYYYYNEVAEQKKTQGFWRGEGIMPVYASNQKKEAKEVIKWN